MLATALGPTGYISQYTTSAVPAKCLYSSTAYTDITSVDRYYSEPDSLTRYNKPLIVLSLAFLTLSYATRVIRIFTSSATLAQKWLRTLPAHKLKTWHIRSENEAGIGWWILKCLLTFTYVVLKALYDIHGSMLWEVSMVQFLTTVGKKY